MPLAGFYTETLAGPQSYTLLEVGDTFEVGDITVESPVEVGDAFDVTLSMTQ